MIQQFWLESYDPRQLEPLFRAIFEALKDAKGYRLEKHLPDRGESTVSVKFATPEAAEAFWTPLVRIPVVPNGDPTC